MRSKQKKIWGILGAVVINTILLVLIVGYSKTHFFDTHEDSQNEEQVQITEIYSVEDYFAFAASVNADNTYAAFEVILYEDLDFSDYDSVPVIGIIEGKETAIEFNGTFDGNGHVISGIRMENPDGSAGMFAKLGGVVKNLKMENCSFSGNVCGAVAAENYEGAILNCYLDVEVAGNIAGAAAGKNYGEISNCVSSSEVCGENSSEKNSCCYFIGKENAAALNDNLHDISARYDDASFNCWEDSETVNLSSKKAELLEKLTARLIAEGQELNLNGYYSTADKQWYFALPASYGDEELYIEATTTTGKTKKFTRSYNEKSVEFVWGDISCKMGFLVTNNVETLYITLNDKDLEYVHTHKKEELSGRMVILDTNGDASYAKIKGFYGHGNDSWKAAKKSYNLKFDSDVDLLGMGENEDYVLLAGYRMNSLMSYVTSGEMTQEVGFAFAPEFRLVNLYVGGEYAGVYFLTEKIELDTNRLDIESVYANTKTLNEGLLENLEQRAWANEETNHIRYYYNVAINPADITGGYLLERDFDDYEKTDSRFSTSWKNSRIILKRAQYSSEEQVAYIAGFWQSFEDALFSEDGYNTEGRHYSEYIDMESFVMQWLMYELSMETSLQSSVYYYKESDFTGDGLLHAVYPWDVERSYVMKDTVNEFGSVAGQGDYWAAYYQHEDFREEAYRIWNEKFIPAIDQMLENLAWYEANLTDLSRMENSRWNECDMVEKCDMIKEVLEIRKEVLSEEFSKYVKVQ